MDINCVILCFLYMYASLWIGSGVDCSCVHLDVNKTITGRLISHPTYNGETRYLSNSNRCWVLRTKLGDDYRIELEMERFSLEDTNGCNFDYLSIYCDRNDAATLIGKFCGNTGRHSRLPPKYMYSSGDRLFIEFISDSTNEREGFSFRYRAVLASKHEASCDVPGLSVAAILGFSFTAAVVITIIGVITFCCFKYKSRSKVADNTTDVDRLRTSMILTPTVSRAPNGRHNHTHQHRHSQEQMRGENQPYPTSPPPAFSTLDLYTIAYPLPSAGEPVAPPPYTAKAEPFAQPQNRQGVARNVQNIRTGDSMELLSVRSNYETSRSIENPIPGMTQFSALPENRHGDTFTYIPLQSRRIRRGSRQYETTIASYDADNALPTISSGLNEPSDTDSTNANNFSRDSDRLPLSPPPDYFEACRPR